ncbi:hypothetical protein BJV82DRAFT_674962 [Fennellomyces sp. T-0311]|nr:hypothetical protein BJV82DRAFT_674962 [Fennellomyces sp. T-0311]
MHSERQHIIDAKKPALRTNRRQDSVAQMGSYIYVRDILRKYVPKSPLPEKATQIDPSVLETTYRLSSNVNGMHTVSSINKLDICNYFSFGDLLSSFLDTYAGHPSIRKQKDMLKLEPNSPVRVFKTLTINDYDTSGNPVQETLRTHESFHNRKRTEYGVFKDGASEDVEVYGNVKMFFTVDFQHEQLRLCLAQRMRSLDTEHKTGLEVVTPAYNYNYKGAFISRIEDIKRSIWIIPDFDAYNIRSVDGYHSKSAYLVNTDTDIHSWINSKGKIHDLADREYVDTTTQDFCDKPTTNEENVDNPTQDFGEGSSDESAGTQVYIGDVVEADDT